MVDVPVCNLRMTVKIEWITITHKISVLDELNITYRSSEKKADLIEKVRHARENLHDTSNDHSMRGHAFFSFKFWNTKTPFGDWSTFRKSRALCLYYYDDRKERLLYLFLHILFLLDAFGAYLEVIFLQQIVFFIIAIFNAALKVCIVNIFIQLLYVWMALVSSWLVAQVNFMTVLGENIPRMFSEETDSRRS